MYCVGTGSRCSFTSTLLPSRRIVTAPSTPACVSAARTLLMSARASSGMSLEAATALGPIRLTISASARRRCGPSLWIAMAAIFSNSILRTSGSRYFVVTVPVLAQPARAAARAVRAMRRRVTCISFSSFESCRRLDGTQVPGRCDPRTPPSQECADPEQQPHRAHIHARELKVAAVQSGQPVHRFREQPDAEGEQQAGERSAEQTVPEAAVQERSAHERIASAHELDRKSVV